MQATRAAGGRYRPTPRKRQSGHRCGGQRREQYQRSLRQRQATAPAHRPGTARQRAVGGTGGNQGAAKAGATPPHRRTTARRRERGATDRRSPVRARGGRAHKASEANKTGGRGSDEAGTLRLGERATSERAGQPDSPTAEKQPSAVSCHLGGPPVARSDAANASPWRRLDTRDQLGDTPCYTGKRRAGAPSPGQGDICGAWLRPERCSPMPKRRRACPAHPAYRKLAARGDTLLTLGQTAKHAPTCRGASRLSLPQHETDLFNRQQKKSPAVMARLSRRPKSPEVPGRAPWARPLGDSPELYRISKRENRNDVLPL